MASLSNQPSIHYSFRDPFRFAEGRRRVCASVWLTPLAAGLLTSPIFGSVAPAIAPSYSRAGVIVNFVTATGGDVEMLRSIECFYK
jgi:hypothetical protein